MANFNTEFKKILQNLENNIKDEKALEAAKVEIFNLYNIFFDAYTNLEEVANSRIAELAQNQLEVKAEVVELKKVIKEKLKAINANHVVIETELSGEVCCEKECKIQTHSACHHHHHHHHH